MTEIDRAAAPMTPQQLAAADRAAARLQSAIDRHAGWDLEADMREVFAAYTRTRTEAERLTAELAKAHSTVTALTQTIRAYPDAVANDAANLAHARAMRAEAVAVARRIWRGVTHPDGEPDWLTYEPQPIAADPTADGQTSDQSH